MKKMQQLSPEWFETRRGKLTASRVKDAISTLKSGHSSEASINYAMELVEERLEAAKDELFISQRMKDGIMYEPEARSFYESITGNLVQEVGFIDHPTIKMFGSSPDGIFYENGKKGVLEIKCPGAKKHYNTLIRGEIPEDNLDQCLTHIAVNNADFCDFVSFRPHIDDIGLKGIIIRHYRNEAEIAFLESKAILFLSYVNDLYNEILSKRKIYE
jgi:putative phage-type endonuclease